MESYGLGSNFRCSKRRAPALKGDDSEEEVDDALMKAEDADAGQQEGDIADEGTDDYQECVAN